MSLLISTKRGGGEMKTIIKTAYQLARLKIHKIVKSKLGDGFWVYHYNGAEYYKNTGMKRDFIQKDTFKNSLLMHIVEARNRLGADKKSENMIITREYIDNIKEAR